MDINIKRVGHPQWGLLPVSQLQRRLPQWVDGMGRAQQHAGRGLRFLLYHQGVGRGDTRDKRQEARGKSRDARSKMREARSKKQDARDKKKETRSG